HHNPPGHDLHWCIALCASVELTICRLECLTETFVQGFALPVILKRHFDFVTLANVAHCGTNLDQDLRVAHACIVEHPAASGLEFTDQLLHPDRRELRQR